MYAAQKDDTFVAGITRAKTLEDKDGEKERGGFRGRGNRRRLTKQLIYRYYTSFVFPKPVEDG